MKKIFGILLIFSIALVKVGAQVKSDPDMYLIDKYINSILTIEKVKITSDTLAKVLKGNFYDVTPTATFENGSANLGNYKLAILDGKISLLEDLGTTQKAETLFSLVREDFYIRNVKDAKMFETALDYIYPITYSGNLQYKKFLKKDGKWYFLRGDFFDDLLGFIVTLDANSKISAIDYDLHAIVKQ
jgi:hypothetical protein